MSIIAHLKQVSDRQLKSFNSDPETAYNFILGDSLPNVKQTSRELQEWKTKNALILLKVIESGARLENLRPEDRLVFEKAHLEFGSIARKGALRALELLPKSPKQEPGLSLEKSWHGIHYLLTGKAKGGRPPLAWAVLGDREIPDARKLMPFGPAHVLTPQQVNLVRQAVEPLTKERFLRRFDLRAMKAAKVYGVTSTEDKECLWSFFQKLRAFYSEARKSRKGLLIHVD